MEKTPILIVDKDEVWSSFLAMSLRRHGYAIETATQGGTAIALSAKNRYDVMITDLNLSDISGLDTARRVKKESPETKIIILTAKPTQESLMEAIHEHLFDYLCKPIDWDSLLQSIERAVSENRHCQSGMQFSLALANPSNDSAKSQINNSAKRDSHCASGSLAEGFSMLIGESEAMRQVRQQIAEVTPTGMTVLIRGESGTGKGVVARLIHDVSSRSRNGAIVKINCPAIPETLLESELFGHEAGSFTGAEGRKPGRFEMANGGTIFLDEIGEIPTNIQVKLLHVIESKEVQRIGSNRLIRVDARILAATNASLEQMIAGGRFRADLFYRLNEYSITLPPLRKRVEDIPLLAEHFLRLYGPEFGHPDLNVSDDVMPLLLKHSWLGNVRELEYVIRRFALTGREESITSLIKGSVDAMPAASARETLRQSEIQTLMSALIESRWNQRRAAHVLGISYSALRRRIEKYGLKVSGAIASSANMPLTPDCNF